MFKKSLDITLYLIRHGEPDYANDVHEVFIGRRPHSTLTEKGKKQCQRLGVYLANKNIKFDTIYTSTLIRSIQSAKTTIDTIQTLDSRLCPNEYIDVPALEGISQGDWEGKSKKELYTLELENFIKYRGDFFVPPGGESKRMVERRASNWLEDEVLYNEKFQYQPRVIAIFSHAVVIKSLFRFIFQYNTNNVDDLELEYTGVSIFKQNYKGWTLVKWNDTSHLG
ncbi:histidine phosphatase family protein [Microcoleus sp. N3A4]|uniref:histidine phosphatase family protein n=1 Tax=Microcoleus sp. N3A4 TaxID=3055379 RepID=UPI002FD2A02E